MKHVDIVVENLKAGAMNRMGLGYEELKKVNPKLIYVAISGFWPDWPLCPPPRLRYGSAGHGRRNEHHRRARRKACPRRRFYRRYHCRYLWCFGAVTALYKRAITGEGDMVDIGYAGLPARHPGKRHHQVFRYRRRGRPLWVLFTPPLLPSRHLKPRITMSSPPAATTACTRPSATRWAVRN